MRRTLVVLALLLALGSAAPVVAQEASLQYLSPGPGATFVSAGTTLALRLGQPLSLRGDEARLFSVQGQLSGPHSGSVILADDQQTLIFVPDAPFAAGEKVSVAIAAGLTTTTGQVYDGTRFSFTVSPRIARESAPAVPDYLLAAQGPQPLEAAPAQTTYQPWDEAALPNDIPAYEVTAPANGTAPGYVFTDIGAFFGGKYFLTILDNTGEPVYYQRMAGFAIDFKRQPNGQLSYCEAGKYYCMDDSYTVVDMWQPGNGYTWADNHDLQILPNGNALLMIYDPQPVDMSALVEGGRADAIVEQLVVQEIDASKNVVFEWRSFDHIPITDSYVSLTTQRIDYIHGNAVELDDDGNLLISSRNTCEITKINRSTGDVIWRLGGKQNDFTFINDPEPWFHFQHDIRRLDNGNISIFDNHANLTPAWSRAVEYSLDEQAMTATRVWEYYHPDKIASNFMGNAQRLPNGNTLIGWGNAGLLTEVKPDGEKAFEIDMLGWTMSYRSFRFEWEGHPASLPTLSLQKGAAGITLSMSWNGATEIASYRVYGGNAPEPSTLLTTVPRAGFETEVDLTGADAGYRYYRVMPVDKEGHETRYSNEATTFDYVLIPLVTSQVPAN